MSDERLFAKCAWRLIPFLMPFYLVSFIDPRNVGFAALTINCLGGLLGPTVMGFLGQETGGYAAGIMALAVGRLTTAGIVLVLRGAIAARGELQRSRTWISRAG